MPVRDSHCPRPAGEGPVIREARYLDRAYNRDPLPGKAPRAHQSTGTRIDLHAQVRVAICQRDDPFDDATRLAQIAAKHMRITEQRGRSTAQGGISGEIGKPDLGRR